MAPTPLRITIWFYVVLLLSDDVSAGLNAFEKETSTKAENLNAAPHQRRYERYTSLKSVHRVKRYGYGCGYCGGGFYGGYPGFYGGYPGMYGGYPGMFGGFPGYGPFGVGLLGVAGGLLFGGWG